MTQHSCDQKNPRVAQGEQWVVRGGVHTLQEPGQGLPWPGLWATAWNRQRLLERRAGTGKRDQETTQEPGGVERAGRSTLPSSRLMCLLLSWVQPSTPSSSLMKGSLRAELVIGGLQGMDIEGGQQHLHLTQALLSDLGCLSICICFSHF